MSSENLSLLDSDNAKVATALAERAAAVRIAKDMRKEAGIGDMASGAWDFVKKYPYPFLGAGAGAAIGGLTAQARDKRRRNTLGSMLTGGLAGAGLGTGVQLIDYASGLAGDGAAKKSPAVLQEEALRASGDNAGKQYPWLRGAIATGAGADVARQVRNNVNPLKDFVLHREGGYVGPTAGNLKNQSRSAVANIQHLLADQDVKLEGGAYRALQEADAAGKLDDLSLRGIIRSARKGSPQTVGGTPGTPDIPANYATGAKGSKGKPGTPGVQINKKQLADLARRGAQRRGSTWGGSAKRIGGLYGLPFGLTYLGEHRAKREAMELAGERFRRGLYKDLKK